MVASFGAQILAAVPYIGVAMFALFATWWMMRVVTRTTRNMAAEVRAMRDGNGHVDDSAPSMVKLEQAQMKQGEAIVDLQRVQVQQGQTIDMIYDHLTNGSRSVR